MSERIRKFIKAYYYFFDHKLKNTTIIIGLVGTLVLCVGIFIGGKYQVVETGHARANVLEIKPEQIMNIGGTEYRVSFKELNK